MRNNRGNRIISVLFYSECWYASFGRPAARKITPRTLENYRMTQTNSEIAGSARFFSSLLDRIADDKCLDYGPLVSTQPDLSVAPTRTCHTSQAAVIST
jgi:hypothetical protein